MPVALSVPVEGVHLQQEAGAFRDPLILIMPILGFYDVIHADGNIGSPLELSFLLSGSA